MISVFLLFSSSFGISQFKHTRIHLSLQEMNTFALDATGMQAVLQHIGEETRMTLGEMGVLMNAARMANEEEERKKRKREEEKKTAAVSSNPVGRGRGSIGKRGRGPNVERNNDSTIFLTLFTFLKCKKNGAFLTSGL